MSSPIVSPETLAAWIAEGRPGLRVVDVRWYLGQPRGTGRAAYDGGHIPGAIHVDLDTDLVAGAGPGRHPLPDPAAFAGGLAALGIGDDDTVVAYDDVGGWVAARLWWMLDDLGFGGGGRGGGRRDWRLNGRGAALVLDGGLSAWIAAGLPMTTDVPTLPPSTLHLAPAWRRVVDRASLKASLGEVLLLDARAGPRYRGETEPIDPVPGHIPTALHAPTDGNLGPDSRFLPVPELKARFAALRAGAAAAGMAAAADPAGPVVTSCGSGVSACHNALAMRIAGLPDPILYPGSYSDWSRAGEPVAVGPEPRGPMTRAGRLPTIAGTIDLPGAPPIPGFVARTPDVRRDLPAIAELIVASNVHDGFDYIPTAETIDHQWRMTPGFEPARDVVVVEVGGRFAALASVTWRERAGKVIHQLEVIVRPEHRRRRIGSALIDWAERRARAAVGEGVGSPTDLPHFLGGWAETEIPGVLEFAAHHGYAPIRCFFSMLRDLSQRIPDLPLPAGLEIRPVREADHRAIWDADVEAFQDHFESGVRTEEDFVSCFTDPDADTSLWLVAWDGAEVAGSVMNAVHPAENAAFGYSRGWLEHVSVRPAWRNRGLASALIGRSLALLRDRGLTQAALGVDGENPTGALRVYERMGFLVHRRAAAFRKSF